MMFKSFLVWVYFMIGMGAAAQTKIMMTVEMTFFQYFMFITCWPVVLGAALVKIVGP